MYFPPRTYHTRVYSFETLSSINPGGSRSRRAARGYFLADFGYNLGCFMDLPACGRILKNGAGPGGVVFQTVKGVLKRGWGAAGILKHVV